MTTRIYAISIFLALSGCATTIPMTSKISDAVLMGVKQSKINAIDYEYTTNVQDGEIRPSGKGTREIPPMSPTFLHTQSSTLDKMLKDYIGMKFSTVDPSAPTKIKVTLKDFWIEQYNTATAGKQFMTAMVGGEMNIAIVAHLNITIVYSANDAPIIKNLAIEADSTHVQGIGTYSATSAYHRGRDSMEFRVAEAINSANNKAIIMLNAFIDSVP